MANVMRDFKWISHRGNLTGRNREEENNPDFVKKALSLGWEVEIDVWLVDDKWYLGHNLWRYEVDFMFLYQPCLWMHAKNVEAALELNKHGLHWFWHETDTMTITSRGYIWGYVGKHIPNTIHLLPEQSVKSFEPTRYAGVCSDYVESYKHEYEASLNDV